MWGAISKYFSRGSSDGCDRSGSEMEGRRRGDADGGSFVTRLAKQRASVKWLLSKAFNNKVPENLKEPFYRDHENQEHLKPQIVGGLANAELYCLALGNIYSDPNYHNLNHWAILQTLSRKGIFSNDQADAGQLTETTLIQTNPLRINAHMAVIEMIMLLYTKEVVTSDRILAAVLRFSHGESSVQTVPDNHEQALLVWICHACEALRRRVEQEGDRNLPNGGGGDGVKLKGSPDLPRPRELKDLCDGVALAALICFYCPDELHWTDIRTSRVPSVQDSIYNLRLVQDFCSRCLPASIFHVMPEDVTYLRDSMKQNLIVFLSDLFNMMEINPAKCVKYPGMDKFGEVSAPSTNPHGVMHKRNLLQTVMAPIPDLRSGIDDPADPTAFQVSRSTPSHLPLRKTNSLQSDMTEDSLRRNSEESFVVHRGKNIPTLRSVVMGEEQQPVRMKVNKERQNNDSKADERGEMAAGRPSNWEENRKSSFAGRRSRRNSVSDDSQLTIENFGGSQDNLSFIGRNPDKEVAVHVGRKISAPSFPIPIENAPVRSTYQDARGSFQLGYEDDVGEKQDNGSEKLKLKRQLSSDDIYYRNINANVANKENVIKDLVDGEAMKRTSFADIGKQKIFGESKGIQLIYMNDKEESCPPSKPNPPIDQQQQNGNEKKTTTFALPNTTTWQQQSSGGHSQQQVVSDNNGTTDDDHVNTIPTNASNVMTGQLNDIRLQLEEKRRHIESMKRKTEVALSKQRQKVGKAAFLQAVAKGRGNILKSPSDANSAECSDTQNPLPTDTTAPTKPQRPFTLQEINDDVTNLERKWADENTPFLETRRTPDLENMDLEQYQQSIAQMNSSLHDIQSDMQRLATHQSQVQQQQLIAQQQRQIQLLQQYQQQSSPIPQYPPPQPYTPPIYQTPPQIYAPPPLQSSSSAPHIPQTLYNQSRVQEQSQFFLHDQSQQQQQLPHIPQRRTWAQQQPVQLPVEAQHQEARTAGWNRQHSVGGFVLHGTERYNQEQGFPYQDKIRYNENKYQNGDEHGLHHSNSLTLSQQHHHHQYGTSHSTPSASPQHRNIHRQISQLMDESKKSPVSLQQIDNGREPIQRKTSVTHAPIPVPSADDMEPQSISFIGSADKLSEGLSRLNITSGSRTYRIPSPTRPLITRNSFQPSPPPLTTASPPQVEPLRAEVSSLEKDPTSQKGFYICFDDDQPKRPKPPLRAKRASPKKERSYVESPDEAYERKEEQQRQEKKRQLEKELEEERRRQELVAKEREKLRAKREEASQERQKVNAASTIIIGNELSNPDPDLDFERERKKERIMLLSLQRKQRQEEAKARNEAEAQARREKEKMKEEEKARKKEEQAARRQAILEQYKLKKAMEEAEREGKTLDRGELSSLKPAPKLRPKGNARPRPKTIHIDSGSVQMAEGMSSKGKKGSATNLTAYAPPPSSMKRDYYKGSQDSLADRSMSSGMLYKDSPDDSRGGLSPCHSVNQTLGRRSSYKTSRDPSPAQVRGRPKYSAYQNFKGRKSSSMMNLYGSSTDQDSMAYRFGDTDSGLGRATPPRRAPSPGMSMRHLPSPSGPGSLPGLMSRGRRMFDDGSSDISSNASSMMDYNGPRLYKQPATKSNRSIILNAVEYCVFPGAVNLDAKKRVLDEINRSESKHFLILFRDAGCQFRALYSYCPEREEIVKLYGTGPRQVNDKMFDKFFKYNSGGKCFSQVHTKHLTVTIDAFTIHNSLWQGKKVNLPNKKDMTLVI